MKRRLFSVAHQGCRDSGRRYSGANPGMQRNPRHAEIRSTQRLRWSADRTHSRKTVGLSVAAALLVLLRGGRRPAFAGVGVGVAPTYPALVQVGDTNVPVGLSVTNTSTIPESGGTLTLSVIRHTPSCGNDSPVPCLAVDADPGVFLVKGPATGKAGTACAGTTFTIVGPELTTGEVEFIPNSPVVLAPVGTGAMEGCTINFLVDVLKLPTKNTSNCACLADQPIGTRPCRRLGQRGDGHWNWFGRLLLWWRRRPHQRPRQRRRVLRRQLRQIRPLPRQQPRQRRLRRRRIHRCQPGQIRRRPREQARQHADADGDSESRVRMHPSGPDLGIRACGRRGCGRGPTQ